MLYLERLNLNALTLAVLCYLGGQGDVWRVKDLTHATGMAQAKAYREVRKMLDHGLLLRVAHGAYVLNAEAGFWQDIYGLDMAWAKLWAVNPDTGRIEPGEQSWGRDYFKGVA